jgi:excisionase family DNA binding protein
MTATMTAQRVRVAVAARQLGASAQQVRVLFDRGELTGVRTAKGYRLVDLASIEAYRAKRYLTVSQAACQLGVSRETVAKRFDAGELAGIRSAAGHRLIDPAALP